MWGGGESNTSIQKTSAWETTFTAIFLLNFLISIKDTEIYSRCLIKQALDLEPLE